jgi:predicted dehydrogenase
MKKLNLAVIGQGRSGKDIHGKYYRSEFNEYYNVKYVVDADEYRRGVAEEIYPGCETLCDYRELFDKKDVDIVVNASYSEMHFSITEDLLLHGFNVLVEKPLARTRVECNRLIDLAKEQGVVLAVFQQSNLAPIFTFAREVIASGKLGELKQISVRFNGFARRWDWQTLQKKVAGGLYNTGPHPVGIGLGLIDFDPAYKVVYTRLDRALTSGDSDDFAKVIIDAPGKPVVDIEVISSDAYCDYNLKLVGAKGTYKSTTLKYKMTYIVDGENPERPVIETFLEDGDRNPAYCREDLIKHTEEGDFPGDAFTVGTPALYKELYFKLTEGKPMSVTPEMAREIVSVIETAHTENPLPKRF